ncbi:hypothetical protein MPTK1_1g22420 [Marchantia polymorpha subsp. ruderalis]
MAATGLRWTASTSSTWTPAGRLACCASETLRASSFSSLWESTTTRDGATSLWTRRIPTPASRFCPLTTTTGLARRCCGSNWRPMRRKRARARPSRLTTTRRTETICMPQSPSLKRHGQRFCDGLLIMVFHTFWAASHDCVSVRAELKLQHICVKCVIFHGRQTVQCSCWVLQYVVDTFKCVDED